MTDASPIDDIAVAVSVVFQIRCQTAFDFDT